MRYALPLLLVLAACGSSSTSTSSSALGGATDESDRAPAPVDSDAVQAATLKSARACSCAEVTINCHVSGPYHARADRAGCALDLPPGACSVLGLEDGAKVDPLGIIAAALPDALDADDVYELCTAKHEARHTCDGASVSACASEISAYEVTAECMGAYASDAKVAHNLEGSQAAAELNACLCGATACETCFAQCKSAHPQFADTCEQARSVYCH